MKLEISVLLACSLYLSGCAAIRAADDSISGVLETIPLLRMVGIESRKPPNTPAISTDANAGSATAAPTGVKPPATPIPQAGVSWPVARSEASGLIPSERLLVLWLGAANWVNPNPMARSAPVRLVIFELQDAIKFQAASATMLLTDAAKALGPDVRRQHEVILAPSETVSLAWPFKQSGYLGVLADFRTPPNGPNQDRQVIALNGQGHSAWRVRVSGNTLVSMPDTATGFASNAQLEESMQVPEMGPVLLRMTQGLTVPSRPPERSETAPLSR
jgi:type VI secretion system VasD/TssJ family lipoprotein